MTKCNSALVRFSAQAAAGLVKVDVNDFLVPRRSGLEEIAPLPRGESLVRKMAESAKPADPAPPAKPKICQKVAQKLRKKRRKLDFSVRKWARFRAQKTGPTSFTNSIGGHRFGAQIPGTEPGPQISPFFALFGGPGRFFCSPRGDKWPSSGGFPAPAADQVCSSPGSQPIGGPSVSYAAFCVSEPWAAQPTASG